MDYICDDKFIIESIEYVREQQIDRLLLYMDLLAEWFESADICKDGLKLGKGVQWTEFWNKESNLECKVFTYLKKCEARHPIICIFIGTVLGGILISLTAGIILEELIMKLL